MGRPRAVRSLSDHNVRRKDGQRNPDDNDVNAIAASRVQRSLPGENVSFADWDSHVETLHTYALISEHISTEPPEIQLDQDHPISGTSASTKSEVERMGLFNATTSLSLDHDFPFDLVGDWDTANSNPSQSSASMLLQQYDQPGPNEDQKANIFLRLSNLQFDLHRRRDELMTAEAGMNSIIEATGLDSIFSTISDVCTVGRNILCKKECASADVDFNAAIFMLILTIILEVLNIYEVLVRIAEKEGPPREEQSGFHGTDIGLRPTPSRHQGLVSFPPTPESSASSAPHIGTQSLPAPVPMLFAIGSFTTSQYLNQVLVLTAMELHLSFIDRFFLRFKHRSLASCVLLSVSEGMSRTEQLRSNIRTILEESKQHWEVT